MPLRSDLVSLTDRVRALVERDDVAEFLILSTVNLERSRETLRAEDLVPVYEADTPEDAANVEEALLREFGSSPKCANDDQYEPDSDTLDDGCVLSVAIAVWYEG